MSNKRFASHALVAVLGLTAGVLAARQRPTAADRPDTSIWSQPINLVRLYETGHDKADPSGRLTPYRVIDGENVVHQSPTPTGDKYMLRVGDVTIMAGRE